VQPSGIGVVREEGAELSGERLDEVVVVMKAAGQDESG